MVEKCESPTGNEGIRNLQVELRALEDSHEFEEGDHARVMELFDEGCGEYSSAMLVLLHIIAGVKQLIGREHLSLLLQELYPKLYPEQSLKIEEALQMFIETCRTKTRSMANRILTERPKDRAQAETDGNEDDTRFSSDRPTVLKPFEPQDLQGRERPIHEMETQPPGPRVEGSEDPKNVNVTVRTPFPSRHR